MTDWIGIGCRQRASGTFLAARFVQIQFRRSPRMTRCVEQPDIGAQMSHFHASQQRLVQVLVRPAELRARQQCALLSSFSCLQRPLVRASARSPVHSRNREQVRPGSVRRVHEASGHELSLRPQGSLDGRKLNSRMTGRQHLDTPRTTVVGSSA